MNPVLSFIVQGFLTKKRGGLEPENGFWSYRPPIDNPQAES